MGVVLTFVTFGIYALYWFYKTSEEMIEQTGSTSNPVLWLLGLFVPFVNWYVIWKYTGLVEKISKGKREQLLMFLAYFVFWPIGQYLTQIELNKLAKV